MKFMKQSTVYASGILVALGAFALTGCDKDKMPDTAEARVQDMAEHLPKSSEGAIFVGDVSEMRTTMNLVKGSVGDVVPQMEATQKQLTDQVGFDPLDENAYKQAGVYPNSGAAVAFVENRSAMMVYVKERQKFDAALTAQAKKAFEIDSAPKSEKKGELTIKVLGTEPSKQIAWTHAGKLAIIAAPVVESEVEGEIKPVADFIASLANTKKAESVATTEQFKTFSKAVDASYALGAYINVKALIANPTYQAKREELAKSEQEKNSLKEFEEIGEVLALGVTSEGTEVRIDAFFGADDKTNKLVMKHGPSEATSPFDGFATEAILLGLRTSLKPGITWTSYKESLGEQRLNAVKQQMASTEQQLGIDIEKDIIANLTGNAGLFFYGINIGAAMGAAQNPMAALKALNLAVGVQFKDDKAMMEVANKIVAKAAEANPDVKMRAVVVDGKEVAEIRVVAPDPSMKFFFGKDLMVFGTQDLTEQAGYEYIMGKSSEAKLSEGKTDIGKSFGAPKPYNGLYVNVDKLNTIVSALAPPNNPAVKVLKKIDAASLTFDASEIGMTTSLRFNLKESGGAKGDAEEKK